MAYSMFGQDGKGLFPNRAASLAYCHCASQPLTVGAVSVGLSVAPVTEGEEVLVGKVRLVLVDVVNVE